MNAGVHIGLLEWRIPQRFSNRLLIAGNEESSYMSQGPASDPFGEAGRTLKPFEQRL